MAKKKIEPKTDIEDWPGGLDIDLSRVLESGLTLRDELEKHVKEELDKELENHGRLLENIRKWQRQFKGIKPPKTEPWVGCFSKDTEVLSEYGWVPVSSVNLYDRLYSVDRKTKKAGYSSVIATNQEWAKELLHFKSKSVDLLVTPTHNMAVQKDLDSEIVFTSAENLLKENRVMGSPKSKAKYKIPLSSIYDHDEKEELYGFDANLLMEFIGWYLSEGWTYKSGLLKKLSSIGIAQTNESGRERIRFVLNGLGLKFSESKNQFVVSVKELPRDFRELLAETGKCNEKFVPRGFMNLGVNNLRSLLSGLVSGDGHVSRRENRNYDVINYYTTSKRLADDVQEIAQKIGLRGSIRKRANIGVPTGRGINPGFGRYDGFEVGILNKQLAKIGSLEIKRVEYNDTSYCFTLRENNTVYVRRNGIAQWCGQCSNMAVPITRSNVENVFVRVVDSIFNRRKPVVVRAKKPNFMDIALDVENALEWLLTNIIKLREKLLSPLLQQLKIGTAIVYIAWEEKRRTIYRWEDETDTPDEKRYKVAGTNVRAIKDTQTIYKGPNIFPIPREDFIISSDARDISEGYLVGFRKSFRKVDVDLRVKRGIWNKKAVDRIIYPDRPTDNEEVRADNQGKELLKTEYSQPYEFWTLWVSYDVDGDDEPDDIMLTVHRDTGAIVRAIYSPTFTGQRPFVRLVGNPTEYSFDGDGFCEVLNAIQEEVDSIHNQRLDRMSQVNSLMAIVQSGAGGSIEDFKVTPGKTWTCDGNVNDVFKEIKFSDNYSSMAQEEEMLVGWADRVTGNTSVVQGASTAERPVFKDSQLQLGESNKKFKSMIDNIVAGITEIIYQVLESYAQYDPKIQYQVEEGGKMVDRSITLPLMQIRDGLDITLAASTEVISVDARREMNMMLYQMHSDYATKLATTVQALTSPMVPPAFKKFLLEASSSNAKFYSDVLKDSERPDADELSLDLKKIFGPEELQAMLQPPPPPPGPPGQPGGGPPGGPPGQMPGPPPGPPGPPMQGPPQ